MLRWERCCNITKGVTILNRIVKKALTKKMTQTKKFKEMRKKSWKYLRVEYSRLKDQQVQRPWDRSVPSVFKDLPKIIPLVINRAARGKESNRLITPL